MKKQYKLKEPIKTVLIIIGLWILITCYLFVASERIQKLDQSSYTQDGHNKSITLIK